MKFPFAKLPYQHIATTDRLFTELRKIRMTWQRVQRQMLPESFDMKDILAAHQLTNGLTPANAITNTGSAETKELGKTLHDNHILR
jgi:hypothetical protein